MSLAPNYDVPENVSPFVPLPLLHLCRECRAPVTAFEVSSVVRDGRMVGGLCAGCAHTKDGDA